MNNACPYPAHRTSRLHPPREYSELQDKYPIQRSLLPSGRTGVVVTRYDHIRRLLDDDRLSADERRPGYPFLYEDDFESPLAGTFAHSDGERHLKVRRILGREFTRNRVEEARPLVTRLANEALDAMEHSGPPAELVGDYALPVTAGTIFRHLGVSDADRPIIESNTRAMMDATSSEQEVGAAVGAIVAHLDKIITSKEQAAGDDLLSRLVHGELLPGNLERDDVVSIAMIVLVSGSETTATMIGLGTYSLLQHPDQLRRLQDDPSLWRYAVDELMRHQTIITNPIQRVAVADIEFEGEVIKAGEGVLMVLEAGNRDPRHYPDPHTFDITRHARDHLTFSHGPHTCLASSFARMELEVIFAALFARFPRLRLAVDPEDVPMRPESVGMYGVERLPVVW
ncbi:cytochrome P450 [Nocardia sp. 004]|uniref:cytochrome P450 n=1 Tax=Nocardia sp. 004 TaxID=3385978 RepID=UPI0039A3D157